MKIVVCGPQRRVGALDADRVIDLNLAFANYLRERGSASDPRGEADERVPAQLERFILGGARTLEDAQRALEHADEQSSQPRAQVKLHAPSVYRPRVACAGGNYARHMAGALASRGEQVSVDEVYRRSRDGGPWGFWKVIDEFAGDGDGVVYPARATLFDYEGEVTVVLGQRASDIPARRAAEHIWGITLLNDWSIRNDMGPARVLNFNMPKNFVTSVSLGPCIVVGELDPQAIQVQTRVNGELRQDYSSEEMTFSFAEFIEFLSRDFSFLPGDLIAGGTGAGTAMDSSRPGADNSRLFLKPGDRVEVSSPGIGTLTNQVVAKAAAIHVRAEQRQPAEV
jgi:2-keto-4-pentenoate hydratase/2-oxohepta-3-ene-1,7-dioic acid hydratase in catechol pathway